jgi:TonB family protein
MIFAILFAVSMLLGAAGAQTKKSGSSAQKEDDKVYKMREVDRKPQVTRKPGALTYGKCDLAGGIARFSVVLHKSGEVRDVKLVKQSPCQVFNESALKAVRQIEFEPAVRDGRKVSVSVFIEYVYSSY